MIITLARCENALVVVGELYQVDAVALAVVSVDFLAALQVVETDAEVFAASHQVLSVVADVHTVNLLLLTHRDPC